MPMTRADALYGNAYRTLFERVGNPDNCTSAERLAQAQRVANGIVEWAVATQPQEIIDAYRRGAHDVLDRATRVLENNLRGQQLEKVRETFPDPPDELAVR